MLAMTDGNHADFRVRFETGFSGEELRMIQDMPSGGGNAFSVRRSIFTPIWKRHRWRSL